MKKFLLFLVIFILLLSVWFYRIIRNNLKSASRTDEIIAVNNQLIEPPDVLSATNLEQWKSVIKDLKPEKSLQGYWMTSRFRAGTPPVLLKQNDQSIIFKAEAVEVTTIPGTTDFYEAQIFSPKMNIDDTRELGLKLCNMFGFNSNEFLAWCNSVGNNWLDAPLFNTGDFKTGTGDQSHQMCVRRTYNNDRPWYIIFSSGPRSAFLKLIGKPSQ